MRGEAGIDVVRILPHRFGDDQRRVGVHAAEDLEALALRRDEAVFLVLLVRMGADDLPAIGLEGGLEGLLHFGLGGPTGLVGGRAQVATGDELDLVALELGGLERFRELGGGHGVLLSVGRAVSRRGWVANQKFSGR